MTEVGGVSLAPWAGGRSERGLTVEEQIADDAAIVDQLGVGGLGLDKVLQKVGLALGKVLVLALEAGAEVLDGDAGDVADVGRADRVDGVLVQPVVRPGHLAAERQVVDGLVGDGERAVVVAALFHVAELGTERDHAHEVPGVCAC
jgi:hypothetical protein